MRVPALTYAYNQDGNLVHVKSVPNGNGCGCTCPNCGEALCAKNGGDESKRIYHFSHQSGIECEGAVESVMHLLAKRVLQETKCLLLPGRFVWQSSEARHFDRVEEECYDKETGLRPDCVGYYGDKKLWVEFKYTHAVDEEKKERILSAHIDCVEIDLGECEQDEVALKKFLTESAEDRIWIRDADFDRREAAKEIIYKKFQKSRNFTIVVPQKHVCESHSSCPLYDEKECYRWEPISPDLKKHGYVECLKDYTFPDTQFKCDLLIKRKDSFENAIAILIETTEHDEHATMTGKRVMVLTLPGDNSLLKLQDGPKKTNGSYEVDYYGFKEENHSKKCLYDISRQLVRFSLFSSGKYYVDTIKCLYWGEKERSSVCQILFEDNLNTEEAKMYGLLTCYKKHRKACYCELCLCLEKVPFFGQGRICTRYKKKGTPKYPLQTKPAACPHIVPDKKIISLLEQDLKQIKMMEQDFENDINKE